MDADSEEHVCDGSLLVYQLPFQMSNFGLQWMQYFAYGCSTEAVSYLTGEPCSETRNHLEAQFIRRSNVTWNPYYFQ